MSDVKMISMTEEEYDKIERKLAWLESLEMAGVDNWNGIDHAYDMFREYYPEYAED